MWKITLTLGGLAGASLVWVLWCASYIGARLGAERLMAGEPVQTGVMFLMVAVPPMAVWLAAAVVMAALYLRKLAQAQTALLAGQGLAGQASASLAGILDSARAQESRRTAMAAFEHLLADLYELAGEVAVKADIVPSAQADGAWKRFAQGNRLIFATAIEAAEQVPGFKAMLRDSMDKDVLLAKAAHAFISRFEDARGLACRCACDPSVAASLTEGALGQTYALLAEVAGVDTKQDAGKPLRDGVESGIDEDLDWNSLRGEPMERYAT
ncbi:hypothetical protein FACS1894186_5100 [Alphaproteobacteria bacterium]|nr:hypothetical protein FACS1894186_5100 [Alphaproteobacteria bacterium]